MSKTIETGKNTPAELAQLANENSTMPKSILSIMDELNSLKSKPINGLVKVEQIHVRKITRSDNGQAYALDGKIGDKRVSSYYTGQVGIDRLAQILGALSSKGGDTLTMRARTKTKEGRDFLDLDV